VQPRITALCLLPLVACGPQLEDPDRSYELTVTGTSDTCTGDEATYEATFAYDIFIDGSNALIQIDSEDFAVGNISGCDLTYQSTAWLEEDAGGNFQWQISGEAQFEGAAGGCDLGDGIDWDGEERLQVVYSENPEVEVGCDYDMTLTGVLTGG